MSDKKINIIIILIIVLSIFASIMLMYYSPKRNNVDIPSTIEVDKIKKFNNDIDNNIINSKSYFTVLLSKYELSDKTINVDINVVKNTKNNTFKIEKILVDNTLLDIKMNSDIIDFEVGIIKENDESKFMYLVTNKGTQDGEGDVIIFNNSGNILYQNNKAYIEQLDDERYLVKEKYIDLLANLTCDDNDIEDIAFKNVIYKSINGQLVNIDYQEIKIGDICY